MAAAADAGSAGRADLAPHDPGLVFARVSRAVRMTIALQSRLAKDLAALDRDDAHAALRRKDQRRMRLSRLVAQAAEAGIGARRDAGPATRTRDDETLEDEIEQLSCDAYERLTEAEDGDLFGLTFDEVVASVCKDLGLSPEWTARLSAAVTPPVGSAGKALAAGRLGPAPPLPDFWPVPLDAPGLRACAPQRAPPRSAPLTPP